MLSVIASCAVAPMGIVILIRVMAIALDKFIYILGIGCLLAVGMFGLPQLEYWTAFWVNLAIGCLFGGARFNGGGKNDV